MVGCWTQTWTDKYTVLFYFTLYVIYTTYLYALRLRYCLFDSRRRFLLLASKKGKDIEVPPEVPRGC